MGRKRLKLAYITNDSIRKSTFNKRKKGLFKKIHEISVLCGIEACAIIYSPFTANPEVWPSNLEVKNIVEKFEMLPEMEKQKNMVDHEGYLRQSIARAMETNNKKMEDNLERTMKEAMFMSLGGQWDKLKPTSENCEDLFKYVDKYLKELCYHKIETFNQPLLEYGGSSSSTYVIAPHGGVIGEVGSSSFLNPNVFNSSQMANESWGFKPMISSSQRLEHEANAFGSNFLAVSNDQQGYYQMMNSIGVYGQHPNQNQYHQQFGYSVVAQDGVFNQNQSQNHLEEWFVDNKCYCHQKP